jgi:plasmid stabilization system protein ParE
MRRFVLSKEARRDLREIKNYVAEDSVASARRVLAEFRHAFLQLGKTPGMGHTRQDLTKRPVLFWPVRSYLIIYRPEVRPLEIVAVLHGKRSLKQILQDRL